MVITIINHPPVIIIDSWYVHHSQSWVVYGIAIPTLYIHIHMHDSNLYPHLYTYHCYTHMIYPQTRAQPRVSRLWFGALAQIVFGDAIHPGETDHLLPENFEGETLGEAPCTLHGR